MSDYISDFDFDYLADDQLALGTFDFNTLPNQHYTDPVGMFPSGSESFYGGPVNASTTFNVPWAGPFPAITNFPLDGQPSTQLYQPFDWSHNLITSEPSNSLSSYEGPGLTTSSLGHQQPAWSSGVDHLDTCPMRNSQAAIGLQESQDRLLPHDANAATNEFNTLEKLETHREACLGAEEHRDVSAGSLTCAQCKENFTNKTALAWHAEAGKHNTVACACGKSFSRLSVLLRHINSKKPRGQGQAKFPCSFCKKHRGKDGFRRKDHYIQHLRGYHKFDDDKIKQVCPNERSKAYEYTLFILSCPYKDCELSRDEVSVRGSAFRTASEYAEHLRCAHSAAPFQCQSVGCDKRGSKGYLAQKPLVRHWDEKHPGEAKQGIEPQGLACSCSWPGCEVRKQSVGDLNWHEWWDHWTSEEKWEYQVSQSNTT